MFPASTDRSTCIRLSQLSRTETFRKAMNLDFSMRSPENREGFLTSEEFWLGRNTIIDRAYETYLGWNRGRLYPSSQPCSRGAFEMEYLSLLADAFVTLGCCHKASYFKGKGFAGYLPDQYGSIPEDDQFDRTPMYDSTKLLIHVAPENALPAILTSERIGRTGGLGRVCFSLDRVCYPHGCAFVFRQSELSQVYPIFRYNERHGDDHLLQEWRSPIGVDLNLAIAAIPITTEHFGGIPAGKAWGTTCFGMSVLESIKQHGKYVPGAASLPNQSEAEQEMKRIEQESRAAESR